MLAWTVRASAVVAVLWASAAPAQGLGALTGTVRNGETGAAIPGAVVTVTSSAFPGELSAAADADGVYRLSLLPEGDYLLRVEAARFGPLSAMPFRMRGGRELRSNLMLVPVDSRSDCVLVLWSPPGEVAGEGATQGAFLDAATADQLPFLRPSRTGVRSWDGVAALAPGGLADTYGHALAGAQSPEHRYLLDGVAVGDPLTGVNAGAGLPLEFLEGVRVTTGGGDASFHSGGGQVAGSLRGGSRELHGAVFATYTPGLLSPPAPDAPDPAMTQVLSRRLWNAVDVGAWVSGAIDRDRLWFFAGLSPSWNRTQLRQSLQLVTEDAFSRPPGLAIPGTERTLFEDGRSLAYAAALTFFAAPGHRVELSVSGTVADLLLPTFHDRWTAVHAPDHATTASLRYAGAFLDGRLLVEATLGWFHHEAGDQLPLDQARAAVPLVRLGAPNLPLTSVEALGAAAEAACTFDQFGRTSCPAAGDGAYALGGPGLMSTSAADRLSARAQVTALLSALGHHQLQAGLELDRSTWAETLRLSGGALRLQRVSGLGPLAWQEQFFAVFEGPDQPRRLDQVASGAASTSVGGFVQDRWAVLDRVTLEAGLRYDTQLLEDAAGRTALVLANQLSPRVGLSWDFTGVGRSRVFAHYGRHAGDFPLTPAALGRSRVPWAGLYHPASCDLVSATSCPAVPLGGGLTSPGRGVSDLTSRQLAVDPALQPPSRDELVAGAEYELVAGLAVGASYTRSWVNRVLEDVLSGDGVTYVLTNPGFGLGARVPAAVRDRDEVALHATRGFADGWLVRLDYTWSSLRGNWSGFFDPEAQASFLQPLGRDQLAPGLTRAFDLPALQANQLGPLPGDVTHVVRAFITKAFELPHGASLLVGLGYQGRSGTPLSYLGASADGPGTVFLLGRGEAGRLPWVHSVNLKLGAGYRLDEHLRVELTLEGLNLFDFAAVTQVDQSLTVDQAEPYTGKDGPEAFCLSGVPGCVPATPFLALNRNFKRPWAVYGDSAYQPPMQWRLGASLRF